MPNTDLSLRAAPQVGGGATVTPARVSAAPKEAAASDGRAAQVPAKDAAAGVAPKDQSLVQVVDKLNSLIQEVRRELHFSIDEGTGRTVIKVIDAQTEEVVRQIPSDQILTMMQQLQDNASSFLMDVEA